jgi:hypothetical protein
MSYSGKIIPFSIDYFNLPRVIKNVKEWILLSSYIFGLLNPFSRFFQGLTT